MNRVVLVAVTAVALVGATAMAEELFKDKSVKMTYILNCAECHGRRAEGSMEGPGLVNIEYLKKIKREVITKIIVAGVGKEQRRFAPDQIEAEMPGFSGDLTKEEIESLTRLIKSWNK